MFLALFFFLFSPKLLKNFNPLFSEKMTLEISQSSFKLGFLALFNLKFFDQPSMHWIIMMVALIIYVITNGCFYLVFSFSSHYFLNKNVPIV